MSGPSLRPADLRRQVRRAYTRAAAAAGVVQAAACEAPRLGHSGLGCGSPIACAALAPGEWVLDLGSGAGFDCLAAAVEVGRTGRVVGIDMTPAMVRLARRHAAEAGVATVHFVQGEIEQLPFPDGSFDVVISNCVINLCADMQRVLAEAHRVLKPGGRLAVADMVALAPLPPALLQDLAAHTGCIAGAAPLEALLHALRSAGFVPGRVEVAQRSAPQPCTCASGPGRDGLLAAATVTAVRPATFE